ncbi:SRPBCC family protein [Nocardia sp. NBC_00508]|uniref:SRPBCC family protein n=1 Tax=Nocardia sp. NBC_00508 TaxID=2975992 RepID=UPI002E819D72|nr:SRPBCC family protein [Nocardia sp. NBC_00508]WUD69380.1 SRPBCC family protein [Nocardia sp. NBC_00508]
MGHIKYASDVGAPVEVAFNYTDNHLFVPDWMFGIVDFVPTGESDRGLGAVFATSARLALWRPNPTCEITEYRRNAVIGYTLRGRLSGTLTLRFDPLGYGRSVLTSEAEYGPPRGPVGRLGAGLVDAAVESALRRTESRLRREIEEFHGTDLVGRIA